MRRLRRSYRQSASWSARASRPSRLWYAVGVIMFVAVAAVAAVVIIPAVRDRAATDPHGPAASQRQGPAVPPAAGGGPVHGRQVCGQPILKSPYHYHGAPGPYKSGVPGLPTYGAPGSDFPTARAGVVMATGKNVYPSYELRPRTVYYLLPGVHVGGFQANRYDAFVGGSYGGTRSVLTGEYTQGGQAIDSNSTDGDQRGVTIEYLTIEKYTPDSNAATINQNAATGWTIRNNTITLNVPGAGAILGANNTLRDNCLTLNGQYGFQSVDVDGFGRDSLTGGPYNVNIIGNEISYNDTCDFEGLLNNDVIGWHNHNPIPERYRNPHCGQVTPNGNLGGFKLWQTNGVTVRNNYIHHNWGPGIWVDTGDANTTITQNTITDNDAEAIIEETSYNFSITRNYLARNDWAGGLDNSGFPSPAIYVSESGSDTTFGGIPGCAEPSCKGQGVYRSKSVISYNTMVDNAGSVFLWQNANRFCSDTFDGICTWVKGGTRGPFTIPNCKANLPSATVNRTKFTGNITGSPPENWWDGCQWRTQNVSITHNRIEFNPAHITDCTRQAWSTCGSGGIFSQYGSPPNNEPGWVITTELTFYQHNTWSQNVYKGPLTFYAWNQGNGENPVSWADWTGDISHGDRCTSDGEKQSGYCTGPFGQDQGSTYDPKPPS